MYDNRTLAFDYSSVFLLFSTKILGPLTDNVPGDWACLILNRDEESTEFIFRSGTRIVCWVLTFSPSSSVLGWKPGESELATMSRSCPHWNYNCFWSYYYRMFLQSIGSLNDGRVFIPIVVLLYSSRSFVINRFWLESKMNALYPASCDRYLWFCAIFQLIFSATMLPLWRLSDECDILL